MPTSPSVTTGGTSEWEGVDICSFAGSPEPDSPPTFDAPLQCEAGECIPEASNADVQKRMAETIQSLTAKVSELEERNAELVRFNRVLLEATESQREELRVVKEAALAEQRRAAGLEEAANRAEQLHEELQLAVKDPYSVLHFVNTSFPGNKKLGDEFAELALSREAWALRRIILSYSVGDSVMPSQIAPCGSQTSCLEIELRGFSCEEMNCKYYSKPGEELNDKLSFWNKDRSYFIFWSLPLNCWAVNWKIEEVLSGDRNDWSRAYMQQGGTEFFAQLLWMEYIPSLHDFREVKVHSRITCSFAPPEENAKK